MTKLLTKPFWIVSESHFWDVSSVDWLENITDQFGKVGYAFSGQSYMETDSYLRYRFIRIRFRINHQFLEKYANCICRQGATYWFGAGIRLEEGKCHPVVWKLQ